VKVTIRFLRSICSSRGGGREGGREGGKAVSAGQTEQPRLEVRWRRAASPRI